MTTEPCLCPQHANVPPSEFYAPRKGQFVQRQQEFFDYLAGLLRDEQTVPADEVRAKFGEPFVKGAARGFFNLYPCLSEIVSDLIPPAPALIFLAERNVGQQCTAENLEVVRAEVQRVAAGIGRGIKRVRLTRLLAQYVRGGAISGTVSDVIDLLIDRYEPEVRAANNAGISLAGRVHELVLQRALELQGLRPGTDFDKPPKPSRQGDIRFHSQKDRNQLRTEVKSLAARERFERGLGELQPPKVGVGFFVDPSEFGPESTRRLLQQGVNAVYMPRSTLSGLPGASKDATNAQGHRFYRSGLGIPGRHGLLRPLWPGAVVLRPANQAPRKHGPVDPLSRSARL